MNKFFTLCLAVGLTVAGATHAEPGTQPSGGASHCSRPAGNTGSGLYVACGRINNPDGSEFRIRGVNRVHFEQGASSGLALMGANTARVFYSYQWGDTTRFAADFNSLIAYKIVPVAVGFTSVATTCSDDPAGVKSVVDQYVADKSTWTQLNGKGILNIANEWGPANSALWRDSYIAAIAKLRAAGFTMPLMIDSGGCGQDSENLLKFGAAVATSDPQKNIILSFHLYGLTPDQSAMNTYLQKFAALARVNPNLTFVVGEFGPGRNIGPSATQISPAQVIAGAEGTGLGWLAWAWDDNNLPDCKSDDLWFSMTRECASYSGDASQLTRFGAEIASQLKQLAAPRARVF